MPRRPNGENIDTNNPEHVYIVKSANYFADTTLKGRDVRNKCCVGYVMGYSSPNPNIQCSSRSGGTTLASLSQNNPKKVLNQERFHKILMLGDVFPESNIPFSVVMKHRDSLFRLCKNSNLAAEITMGDTVAVLRPAVDDRTLGTTPILRDPRQILLLKRNVSFPEKPLQMAAQPGHTIFFRKKGVKVDFYNPVFLCGNEVPCISSTCDRQDPRCQGCHGNTGIKRNFVLRVGVDVLQQPDYDASKGIAQFEHRSWMFTQEVIRNLREMATLDYGNLWKYEGIIKDQLTAMATLVNENGGWTVMGWHRRGTVSTGTNSEPVLSLSTRGHLTRITPTNLPDDKQEEYASTCFHYRPGANDGNP